MQTVSTAFQNHADGQVRPISYKFMVSFDKQFEEDIDFFTVGVSEVGGDDFIPGTGIVVQEWDKYAYVDYSDRVVSLEWTREEDTVWSVAQAFGDIVLDNHDGYFSPGEGSPIEDFILPERPVRILAGFDNELVQTFVGLTDGMPVIDRETRTASFRVIDFLTFILNRPLEQGLMYIEKRTDEILDDLLTQMGFLAGQYSLDVGLNTVHFTYYEKGEKFGDIVKKLMEAEMGRFFMDEEGVIRFRSRQYPLGSTVHEFTTNNATGIVTKQEDEIYNVVEVTASIRVVQDSQVVWETTADAIPIEAGDTVEVWANFDNPVTTIVDPEPLDAELTSFYYGSSTADVDGVNMTSSITLNSLDLFSTSAKMEFENTSGSLVYLVKIQLYGTPAIAVQNLFVREEDAASIDKYGEKIYTIDNNLIQSESEARSIALTLLELYSEYGGVRSLDVKSNPAWQLADVVDVTIDTPTDDYQINSLQNVISESTYRQTVGLKGLKVFPFFTVELSEVGGGDMISP